MARIREEDNGDKVWSALEAALPSLRQKGIVPLYLSKRAHHMDTSMIVSSQTTEAFFDSLLELLKGISTADGIWIFQLLKPKFFDIPENIGKEAVRYLMTITTRPADAQRVYEMLSSFRQSSDLAMTYIAYTCQRHCDTLTLSAFAKSDEHVNRFVEQELKVIPGITRVQTIPMVKSKRLLPYAEMVRILRSEVGNIDIARPMMDLSDFQ